jgi:hypothetical protein
MAAREKKTLYCTFYRKAAGEVEKLIAGPGVYACIGLFNTILAGTPIPEFPGWDLLSDAALLGMSRQATWERFS